MITKFRKNMNIEELNKQFKDSSPEDVLEYFLKEYKDLAALSSSFGAEDQVLTHMMLEIDKNAHIFTLDTGRLHPETYSVMDATNLKYGTKVKVFFPKISQNILRFQEKLKSQYFYAN